MTIEEYNNKMNKLMKSKKFDKVDFGEKFNLMINLAAKCDVFNTK